MAADGAEGAMGGGVEVVPVAEHHAARLGSEQEGVKRRAMRFGGVYHDALLMSLLDDAPPMPAP